MRKIFYVIQSSDGSWGNETTGAEILPATVAAIEALKTLNQTNSQTYTNAITWIQTQGLQTTDYFSERIHALMVAGADRDVLLSYLDDLIGAWGGYNDYEVNSLDTALALQALKIINYQDQETISYALGYLQDAQNPDGGWGFCDVSTLGCADGAGDSNVYMTAVVLQTLLQFKTTYDLNAQIASAAAYLIDHQNPDGGFGSSPSTVYETALAMLALIESGQGQAQALLNALDYLTTTQLTNGSWNNDPYSTAHAIRALSTARPNLSVISSDIAFSNPNPTVGDTISITAKIKNTGPAQADNITVRFFDGDPAASGAFIGDSAVTGIAAYEFGQASMNWTISAASSKLVYVVVDPDNTIDELIEADNGAYRGLTSATLPDLNINAADIEIFPSSPEPFIMVGILFKVRNIGETDAGNVGIDIYDGDPAQGHKLPGSGAIVSIPAGGTVDLAGGIPAESVIYGSKRIYIVIDPNNTIAESNETNNVAVKAFNIGAGVELSISSSNITFSSSNPREGDTVTISSIVTNYERGIARDIVVRHYLGDPAKGGSRIGSDIIIPSIGAWESRPVAMDWNTAGMAGKNNIFIVVDPDNAIVEINNYDNKASKTLIVTSNIGPDLAISSSDIAVVPQSPMKGQTVTVSATIRNVGNRDGVMTPVEFRLIDQDVHSYLIIGTVDMAFIPVGGSATTQISWEIVGLSGNYGISVVADPNDAIVELDESNNAASVPIDIAEPLGPDLVPSNIDLAGVSSDAQNRIISGNLSVTVKNEGNQPVDPPFTLTAFEDRNNNATYDPGIDAVLGSTIHQGSLDAGSSGNVIIPVSGTVLYTEVHLYLMADSANSVAETDEANNATCLGIFNPCRYTFVDSAIKSGAEWLNDHQLRVDAANTMRAWGGVSLNYNALAVNAYKATSKTSQTKYSNILNKLVLMQAPDGSWDEGISKTAEAMMSLLNIGIDPNSAALTNAVSWLIRQQNADHGWGVSKGSQSTAYYTGLVLKSLIKAGINKNEPFIQNAAAWLKATQNPDGYWGWYPGATSMATIDTYPVVGLALATSPSDSNVQKAKNFYNQYRSITEYSRLYWLKMMIEIEPSNSLIMSTANELQNMQKSDGGWTSYSAYSFSFFEMTADTLHILGRLGIAGTRINNGIMWIENHINASWEAFPEQKYIVTTDVALDALQAANIGDAENLDMITKGRKAIVTSQNYNGSWADYIPVSYAPFIRHTGESLFALKYYKDVTSAELAAAFSASNFLIGAQLSGGGWPDMKGYTSVPEFLNSEAALLSLLQSGLTPTHTAVSKGLSYINSKQNQDGGFGNTELTARAAVIYKLAGAGYLSRLNQTVTWIKANQNPDGGWGTMLGYTSSTGSTSWALIALSNAGESGIEVARGVSWLLAAQNEDNGWGALMGIPMSYEGGTSLAVWALSLAKFTLGFDLDLMIDQQSYCPSDTVLITVSADVPAQDISMSGTLTLQDGGSYQLSFDTLDSNFVSDFQIPSDALPGVATVQAIGLASYGYGLETKRFYIKNCDFIMSDLFISDSEVTDTRDSLNPDIRTINAIIRNFGNKNANNVRVNFYQGSVRPEDLIKSEVIPSISIHGSAAIGSIVTVSEDTVVYVVADPEDGIEEISESNNIGAIVLTRVIPDLSVAPSDISIIPQDVAEGQNATIAAIVHNLGNLGAPDVFISFYDGDPQSSGTLIGAVTKSSIEAGSTAYAEVPWSTFGQSGRNYIHVIVDPLDSIRESNEGNNSALIAIDLPAPIKPDLAVTSSDLSFSNLNPSEGEMLTISANIHNLGIPVSGVEITLYLGDPASGGVAVTSRTTPQIIPFGGAATVSLTLDTAGLAGERQLYISVDPGNRIPEVNESNNTGWGMVTIGASGLSMNILTDKAAYFANENINVSVTLENLETLSRTGMLELKLIDDKSNVVANSATAQTVSLPPLSNADSTITINTGQTIAGSYRVLGRFIESNLVSSRKEAPIVISPVKDISSKVVTNRTFYYPNQQATITSTITSQSPNYIFENLTAKVDIKNLQGTILYTGNYSIPILAPGQITEFKTYWNTSTNLPAAYPVTLTVTDPSGAVVSSGTATVTITDALDPSALLTGQISVDRQSLLQGVPVNISYLVTNVGNIDLSQVDLSIRTVHVVKKTVYDLLADQTALVKGASFMNAQLLSTGQYSAKDYLVILSATIAGVEETLASTYFRVEGAPSAPSLNTPSHGADIETTTPALSVNNATDSNDDRMRYEFELYSDANLTTSVAASGLMDEGTAITSWQEPVSLQENAWYFWRARAFDGLLYSAWMSPVAFRVNVINEAPGAPSLSSPSEGGSVDTQTLLLTVNNAADPDSTNLTYNFVVASDPELTEVVASQVGVFEGQGTTSWQVIAALQENTWYYWTAQADDWLITGPWMPVASFFVNTSNEAPSAPVIIEPVDGTEVSTTDVLIRAQNSTDPDSSALTYLFEADTVPTFDSPDRLVSGSLPQGAGTTTWLALGLKDNTWYYARVKASDGQAESPMSEAMRFFVNTGNDAPTAPVLSNPSNGAGVNSFTPELSVHNATDIDNDSLTYNFEVYADASLTNLISSASGIQETALITTWMVPGSLTENSTYYWRARAFDGQLYGPWMPAASFIVNTANDAPTAPTLNSPAMGSSLSTLTPVLAINNATDPDSDVLTYDFEIYLGGVLVNSVVGIPQDISGVTSYAVSTPLSDNTTYQWRARAHDGDRYGAWMDMATFSLHLPSQNITSTIDFDPNTLNQKSKGNWVTVYIELPAGYNVADISISSLRLNGTIPAVSWPYAIGDYDHDGIPDLMVKFDRNAVINLLPAGDNIMVTVTGTVGTTTFEGVDTIRVIH